MPFNDAFIDIHTFAAIRKDMHQTRKFDTIIVELAMTCLMFVTFEKTSSVTERHRSLFYLFDRVVFDQLRRCLQHGALSTRLKLCLNVYQ